MRLRYTFDGITYLFQVIVPVHLLCTGLVHDPRIICRIGTLQFENDTIKVQLEEANTSVTQLEETREYAYGQRITAESK